jgi:hypothetical protein
LNKNRKYQLKIKSLIEQIILQDDSDGVGAYIAEWKYSKPIPEGLTLGKPSA